MSDRATWLENWYPTRRAAPGAPMPHAARLRAARGELLLADAVFAELDRLASAKRVLWRDSEEGDVATLVPANSSNLVMVLWVALERTMTSRP